jgi:APA family basic amino acid/polyamine antiporter
VNGSTAVDGVTPAPQRGSLLRVLGTVFGIAIGVGATIGGGILRTPGEVAAHLPSTALFLGIWIFGGLNALLGATVYSELGAMIPRSGGIFVFARRALGDGVGFFVGYADWVNWCAAGAALSLLVGEYIPVIIPQLTGHATAVAFTMLAALAVSQWQGVRWGARIQEVTSALKALGLLGLIIAIVLMPHPETAAAVAPVAVPQGWALVIAIALALQGVIFTYDAYYIVIYCGEEMRNPGREIPRSIFGGLWLIIGIYVLLNAAFLLVMSVQEMAGESFVGGAVASALFGPRGDQVIRTIMVVSIIGTTNAHIIAAPRILLAMGREGLFPKQGTTVNERGVPTVAFILSTIVMFLFLLSGSFNQALSVISIVIVVNAAMTLISFFVLRRREPDTPRPYRAWGYPWVQALALTIAVVFLITNAFGDVKHSLIALAIIVASYPASHLVRRLIRAGWIPLAGICRRGPPS